MKIAIVGANGAVGKAALEALAGRHEIIRVGRTSGDVQTDLKEVESIRAMYRRIGNLDAIVCAVGTVHFGPLCAMTGDEFMQGIFSKLLPQVNLVLEGFNHINDGGSFTLTSGVSNRDPIRGGAAAAAANGALDGFVIGAAVEMPRALRINAVSPEALEVSRGKHPDRFHGHRHVSKKAVGEAYSKAVEGCRNGQILIVE